jgi:anti-anti-sigma factor
MSTLTNQQPIEAGTRVVKVSLPDNILSTNAHEVRARLATALSEPRAAEGSIDVFELDITGAQMVDSVGLNLLVWLLKAVRERRARLRLIVASFHVERTLQFTRLDQQVEVVTPSI